MGQAWQAAFACSARAVSESPMSWAKSCGVARQAVGVGEQGKGMRESVSVDRLMAGLSRRVWVG
ncbi:hypothetical protein SAV31267_101020 [Streptomyces avermitilis]|uniref:Uncharacterized protein n=1 Tax=Streptomyces avermitilis TaxID=33903 RepID=A0A4D4NBQ6_STRAX|nr:hypothetical protein SAV31267_101020 [Streptomyces avermitilis]